VDGSHGGMVPAACFRDVLSAWPTGVAVVTAVGVLGRRHGCTVTSVTGVTLEPPTLLVCLDERSGTLAAVRRGQFAVNFLHARAQAVAELFASPRTLDRFAQVPWTPTPRTGQPWLYEAALAVVECQVTACSTVGDHAVVLGEVLHVEQQGVDVPLLYGLRQFAAWPAALDGAPL